MTAPPFSLAPLRHLSPLLRWLAWCLLAWLAARVISEGADLAWRLTHSTGPTVPVFEPAPDTLPVVGASLWAHEQRDLDGTLPTTRLPLAIVGVARGIPLSRSVLILDTPGEQRVVTLGERIDDTVRLAEITPEGLILDNQGRQERLPWPEHTASTGQGIVAAQPAPSETSSRSSLAQTEADEPGDTRRANWPTDAFHSRFGDDYRQQLLDDPTPLLRYFRAAPVIDGSRLIGYRLRPGSDASLFEALPLENGDIVTAVEGHPIGDGNALALLRTRLRDAHLLRVQVQRDGQAFTLELELSS